jgi:hypothetical protein
LIISSIAAATPSSISSITLHMGGTSSETILIDGTPLLDAADLASLIKPLLHRVAVGLFLSSNAIA